MAQSIITVPLYSVEENDGLNRSLRQKTFKEAVARMYREHGMYIVYNRQMSYDRFGRSPNMLDVPVIFAFGRLYDTEGGRKVFGAKHPYLLNWFDEIEQLGFDHFVYNHRIKKVLAVNEEENVILDDAVCQRLALGKEVPGYGSKREWLLSEPVFKPICAGSDRYDYAVLSKVLSDIRLNPTGFQGFASYSQVYYADGTMEISGIGTQYVFDDCIVEKGLLRHMFAGNRAVLNRIKAHKGHAMILDSNKQVYPLMENSMPIKRRYVEKWLSNV